MKRFLILISITLLAAFFLNGCSSEIKGPERKNVPPEVHFVNIPVAGAKFSSDTTLYWYGTDIDGFITQFRYAVVRATDIGVGPGSVDFYLDTIPVDGIPWIELNVELNDPQTNARVSMSADISDPVRTYVESYIFLQAIDNMNGKSKIIYQSYLRNNHFPETKISSQDVSDPYVNALTAGGLLDGVSISWSGDDPIDYPRNPPPFEFQWKLFGPFDTCQLAAINEACVEPVFVDIYGDFYYSNKADSLYPQSLPPDTSINDLVDPPETTIVIDTLWHLVDTLPRGNPFGVWHEMMDLTILENLEDYTCDSTTPEPLHKLVEESFDPLSGEEWVYDVRQDIFDVFRKVSIDTTSMYYFLFWCQTRDEASTPDPVPAFKWVSVIEPKFEREVIIVDATVYKKSMSLFWNWPVYPQNSGDPIVGYPATTPIVKDVYGQMINAWAPTKGISDTCFDTDNLLPDVFFDECVGGIRYEKYHATQDYYPIAKLAKCEPKGLFSVTLRDILKHKVILLIKDMPGEKLQMNHAVTLSILDGLRAGMSCWSMVRSPFSGFSLDTTSGGTYQDVPASYQEYFGVVNMWHTGWMGTIMYHLNNPGGRNEDFIGATVLPEFAAQGFPSLSIDTTFLEDRYLWIPGPPGFNKYDFRCHTTGEILIGALPEVGYIEKSPYAEAMYLYQSKYGSDRPEPVEICFRDIGHRAQYQGAVVAARLNAGAFRTSHFSFSLLPMEEPDAQECFNVMMDWLYEPFDGVQLAGKRTPRASRVDAERLKSITRELHELKAQGLLETNEKYSD